MNNNITVVEIINKILEMRTENKKKITIDLDSQHFLQIEDQEKLLIKSVLFSLINREQKEPVSQAEATYDDAAVIRRVIHKLLSMYQQSVFCDSELYKYKTKPISECGYILNGQYSVNISNIMTRLIQETGRYCESYASDIYYTLKELEEYTEKIKNRNELVLIGMCDCGIHEINADTIGNPDTFPYRYRKIYGIRIVSNEKKISVVLFEVEPACIIKHKDALFAK